LEFHIQLEKHGVHSVSSPKFDFPSTGAGEC
jgi:hypothetical protein